MVKIKVSENFITIVLHQEFYVFRRDSNKFSWEFDKVVKCTENVPKSDGSIECCAFSPCEKYFGMCFDKNIIIYTTCDWTTLHVCPGERKASSLQFFPSSKLVLIADKSGCANVYSFIEKLQKTELSLGHNSMLTDAVITNDEKFVITSDRDEKIRVTNFPNLHNIEKYCLGHEMFVTCIAFLPTDRRILVSSSGDGTIRFWNFILGQQLALHDFNGETDSKKTIAKFVSCEINQTSIVAVLEYKSNEINILTTKGNLDSLKINLLKTITLRSSPWDIEFCNKVLLCLVHDKSNPVVIWYSDLIEPKSSFSNITLYLSENWDSFLTSCNKITDEFPVLFKREVDNLQEYEQRKKARLLKTGKTS